MSKLLYNFVGAHSLLGGLFLFFLPVLLYTNNFWIIAISSFIAITWVSFLVALLLWDRIRFHYGFRPIIVTSFLLQILLVGLGYLEKDIFFLVVLAITYGFYNCFFWITKRFIFSIYTTKKSIWNEFGNMQILAFVLVKIGILFSSFFLEYNIYSYIFWLIVFVSMFSLWYFLKHEKDFKKRSTKQLFPPISLQQIYSFKDNYSSKSIFLLDGPFLYLESFFWIISLFFISTESFQQLGIIAIWLALSFTVIFFIIKWYIDHLDGKKLYILAVILFSIWWLLRASVGFIESLTLLYSIIVCITFCSTFFRLVFNKNFFVLSKQSWSNKYLLLKSYYSQASVMITFSLIALGSYYLRLPLDRLLVWSYLVAFVASLYYLCYHIGNISLKD